MSTTQRITRGAGRTSRWWTHVVVAAVLPVACHAVREDGSGPGLRLARLSCEYLQDPVGIDAAHPRLGWVLLSGDRSQWQTAYRVLVASSPERLARDEGDLWDSGRVESDRSCQVEYGGAPLASRQRCYWKARVWDRGGLASPWSAVACWEMGLLSTGDWHGHWIARTEDTGTLPAPHLRKTFAVHGKVRRASLYVCGLGYHEASLNGQRVGDHLLDPGYTRYDRRALYVSHDVTDLLVEGPNALGVILGNGWYNVRTLAAWDFHEAPWRASPRLLLELRVDYEDGREQIVSSDTSWLTSTGPILFDSIYGGETYDARLETPGWDTADHDDSSWDPALRVEPPSGVLSAQPCVPIRETRVVRPVAMTEPRPGVFVFDMGQNLAGVARLAVTGPAGTEVELRYAEKLHEDGTADWSNIAVHMKKTDPPQRFQTDRYILKGNGREEWQARFCYHGFQYVQVTGAPGPLTRDSLSARVVHSSVPARGYFECSDPLLNRVWEASRWSFLSNLHSIPTDCPHREKNGWTGDAHLAAEQAMYGFDPASVYTKWVRDLHDEQKESGELPGIVPTGGWGYAWGNGPAWDSALVLIPWYMYLYYGDTAVLAEHYDAMRRYVDYLTTKAEDGIVSIGLGDWAPFRTETPAALTSTGYYYVDARIVARIARLLGLDEDAQRYDELADSIRAAFHREFWDEEKGVYAEGSQTALACALYQGLAPDELRDAVLEKLVARVAADGGHIDTGILGAKYLLRALTDGGRLDVAHSIAARRGEPGWVHWIERGATTLWEQWNGEASRCHIMYGDVSAWFFEALAGIRQAPGSTEFRRLVIRPGLVGDLTYARAAYDSIRGLIISSWRVEEDGFSLSLVLPPGSRAEVHLPASPDDELLEGEISIGESEGVRLLRREEEAAVLEVESGAYLLRVISSPEEE